MIGDFFFFFFFFFFCIPRPDPQICTSRYGDTYEEPQLRNTAHSGANLRFLDRGFKFAEGFDLIILSIFSKNSP